MALVESRIDDIDGSADAQRVTFSFDGVEYEIDLARANADKFRAALNPWIEQARRVGGRRTVGVTTRKRSGQPSGDEVREWARQNGHNVKARGRVSAEIMAAYEAAHSGSHPLISYIGTAPGAPSQGLRARCRRLRRLRSGRTTESAAGWVR